MYTASEKLTIELPWTKALAVYRRRLLLILSIGVGNLVLLGLVLLLSVTSLGAVILTATATFLATVGGFLSATGSAALTSITIFFVKHWLLASVIVVVVFMIMVTRKGRKR